MLNKITTGFVLLNDVDQRSFLYFVWMAARFNFNHLMHDLM